MPVDANRPTAQLRHISLEELPPARGRVLFDPQWCRTCRVCEAVCSITHEGWSNPATARINVTYDEFATSEPIKAVLCAQCADAPCIPACPAEAMTRHPVTGAVLVIEDRCIGCLRCRKACPWQVPKLHPKRKVALKCDLCSSRNDGPLCVRMCPLSGKALRYEADYYTRGQGDE